MSDVTRITGMVTGLDTDQMVKDLVSLEQRKIDKVLQNKQYIEWQQDSYRDIASIIRGFKSDFFDFLNPESNLLSTNTLNSYAVTYNGADTSDYIDITATSKSSLQNQAITSIITAKAAQAEGTSLAGPMKGIPIADLSISANAINSANDNNTFLVTLNGVSEEITITDNPADIAALQADLQDKIDTAFGVNTDGKKITVVANADDSLSFETADTNTLSLDYAYNTGASELFGKDLSAGLTVTEQNNKFKLTQTDASTDTSTTHTIALTTGTALTINQIITDMQNQIDTAFGDGTLESSSIRVVNKDNKIVLESLDSNLTMSIGQQENGGLAAIGFDDPSANTSNKIRLSSKLSDIAQDFDVDLVPSDIDGDGNDLEFTINGKNFAFNSTEMSLQDIIDAVDADNDAAVTMKYDTLNDRVTIEANETGSTVSLTVNDSEGNFMATLGLDGTHEGSTDAAVKFSDGTTVVRSTNNFEFDGLRFELKEDFTGSLDFDIDTDTTKSMEVIKGFVEKYNDIVTKLNDKVGEKRYYDYKPLTDAQKEDMSEKEIEMWEEKAKSGILRNDGLLQDFLTEMRSALYQQVEGAGINLSEIGITTSTNYMDGGKLVINEDKLEVALKEQPEKVVNLFTQDASSFGEKGLSNRLYDIIQKNIRVTRDNNGYKGLLLEKAGIEGDVTQYDNILSDRMEDYDDMVNSMMDDIARKETEYYNMFARMEAAISRLNSQAMWLQQQFGGSGMM